MNATDVARNALTACLVISADATDIHTRSPPNGASSCVSVARSAASHPITTRSGLRKQSSA